MPDDAASNVRALLAAAGLAPPEAEVVAMIEAAPALRAAADALYTDEISAFEPVFLPIAPERPAR